MVSSSHTQPLLAHFEALGKEVEEQWRRAHYSGSSFPEIATKAIEATDFISELDPDQVLAWIVENPVHPRQQDELGRFGQPPITLFYGPRFCIDIYFWMASTTTIHDHGFSGAFSVLKGSSVQTRYRFHDREEINPHFYSGNLSCVGADLLRPGDVRTIHPGDEFIHSVFHLEHPSVTLCIRTLESRTPYPQCDFYPPYFARSPFYFCSVRNKRVAAIQTLAGMGHQECDAVVERTLANCDFQTAFEILRACWIATGANQADSRFQSWLEVTRNTHPRWSNFIVPTFLETQRQGELVHRRSTVTQKDHRFFLAVFLTITDRQTMLDFVQREYPEHDPAQLLTGWLKELSLLQPANSYEENALGIAGIGQDYLLIFEHLLRGLSFEQIFDVFRKERSEDYVEEFRKTLLPLMEEIKATPLFAPQLNS